MTEEIIIDVSNCSHKRDDECMEVPICNEYGDLMGYQSCEAQTLCPYRSQKKIEHLEQLKNKYYQQTLGDEITISDLITKCNELEQENKELREWLDRAESGERNEIDINNTYRSALDTIQRMILSAWEQGKYLDGGLYNDLINEFTKINEVLK